jgi:SAM-dependent methyltransferase
MSGEQQAERYAARRTSFGSTARDYDAVRPEWPEATVTWMLGAPDPGTTLAVVDLGCGTGKGSRALATLGHQVEAVDPSDGMLEALEASRATLPPTVSARLRSHRGGAEAIPLPDGTADAVTVFQAWHWFDPEPAVLECARVLRPGGWLSMAWHHRDDRSGWGAELSAIVEHAENIPDREDPPPATAFDAVETEVFGHLMRQSVDDLVRHAGTWSFVAIHPERERMLQQVRELGRRVADPDGWVEIPMRTRCYRLRRR